MGQRHYFRRYAKIANLREGHSRRTVRHYLRQPLAQILFMKPKFACDYICAVRIALRHAQIVYETLPSAGNRTPDLSLSAWPVNRRD